MQQNLWNSPSISSSNHFSLKPTYQLTSNALNNRTTHINTIHKWITIYQIPTKISNYIKSHKQTHTQLTPTLPPTLLTLKSNPSNSCYHKIQNLQYPLLTLSNSVSPYYWPTLANNSIHPLILIKCKPSFLWHLLPTLWARLL